MFRREEVDGEDERYTVVGLWGSGNVVEGRSAEAGTAYSMWDGHALFGPGRPGEIEKFPALVAQLDVSTFVERYGSLGDENCELWDGEEVLGAGCSVACASLVDVCPGVDPRVCLEECADEPRQVVECIYEAPQCDFAAACGLRR